MYLYDKFSHHYYYYFNPPKIPSQTHTHTHAHKQNNDENFQNIGLGGASCAINQYGGVGSFCRVSLSCRVAFAACVWVCVWMFAGIFSVGKATCCFLLDFVCVCVFVVEFLFVNKRVWCDCGGGLAAALRNSAAASGATMFNDDDDDDPHKFVESVWMRLVWIFCLLLCVWWDW